MSSDYEVQEGDCIGSIAFANGFAWETLWNHPNNAALKSARKDPNVLFPGDIVHLPDPNLREVPCATDQQHMFKLKNVPAKFCIRLLEEQKDDSKIASATGGISDYCDPDFNPKPKDYKPRANVPYLLFVDDEPSKRGKSDGSGKIEIPLSPAAVQGRLVLNPGTQKEETYPLRFGTLDPVTEISGVKQRLLNLGFPCGTGDDETPELEAALFLFQEKSGLSITGKLDDPTRQKLKAAHGG